MRSGIAEDNRNIPPATAFERAFEQYIEELRKSPKRRDEWKWLQDIRESGQPLSAEEIHGGIARIQAAKTETKGKEKAGKILVSIVHGINKYREVIDTLGDLNPKKANFKATEIIV